jgi:hypothetical protein
MAIKATEEGVKTVSVQASAAVAKNRFVKRGSGGKYAQVGTAQLTADGISAEAAAADGDTFAMKTPNGGICIVEAGAAMATDGILIASDNVGRCIAYVADAAGASPTSVACCLGRLRGTASAAGAMVEIEFVIMGNIAGTV